MSQDTIKTESSLASKSTRRKFLKGAAATTAGASAAIAAPHVARAQNTVLKMQGSWGASDIFSDMARQYADRVGAMSGGSLTIDYLPAGAVVGAFQVQDACHDGVLDGAHTVTAYWYGKDKAASLFGTGPVFGANATQILAWIHFGGGKAERPEFTSTQRIRRDREMVPVHGPQSSRPAETLKATESTASISA